MAEVVLQDYRQVVLSNDVVTASGSAVFDGFGAKELNLLINVSGSVTGTGPTLTFTIQEVDPGDMVTPLGNSKTGTAISATGTQIVSLPIMYGGTVLVSWTIGGTGSPTFNGVYASLISKVAGSTALYDASGNAVYGSAGTPGSAVLSIQGVVGGTSIPVTLSQTDRTATGAITSTQTVQVNSQGSASTGLQITGTWTGTIVFEASVDGTNWNPVNGITPTTGASQTSTTTNGNWEIASAGYQLVRVRGNTVATGSATAYLNSGAGTQVVEIGAPLPAGTNTIGAVTQGTSPWVTSVSGTVAVTQSTSPWVVSGTVTSNQGSPNTLANAWPTELTDGTNGPAAIKPASTAATATDPALVVAISPNSNSVSFTSNDVTQSGALGSNGANVAVTHPGLASVGFQLDAGTFIGTIVAQVSYDGGTTWNNTFFVDPATLAVTSSLVFAANNTAAAKTIVQAGGAGMTRVFVSAYTSGTANAHVRASDMEDTYATFAGPPNVAIPPAAALMAGTDATVTRVLQTDSAGRQIVVGKDGPNVLTVTNPVLTAPYRDDFTVGEWSFGESYRLRVGNESLGFLENFDGTTVNTVRWTQSNLTMTQSQAQTAFTLNANSTTSASTYSILTSTKSFQYTGEYGLEARFRGKIVFQANAVTELGFLSCATTATPTNGVFFRITSTGTQQLVINYNGTETTATIGNPIASGTNYQFILYMYGTIARLDILNWDNSASSTTTLQIPTTQAALIQTGHIPVAARVYNTATPPGAAAQIVLAGVTVSQLDLSGEKAWEAQLGDMMRFANTDPLTGTQLQNSTNNTAPTTIAAASLSNTAAAYTTLGGDYAFHPPATSENDFIIFAYQVPSGFDLMLWSITIQAMLLGAQSTSNPQVYEWGIAVGSSAVSLATGAPNSPIRQVIGMMQSPKSASIGDSLNPAQLIWTPRVPITCYGGKYVHVFFRPISSNLTSGQVVRGCVTVDGAFQ